MDCVDFGYTKREKERERQGRGGLLWSTAVTREVGGGGGREKEGDREKAARWSSSKEIFIMNTGD